MVIIWQKPPKTVIPVEKNEGIGQLKPEIEGSDGRECQPVRQRIRRINWGFGGYGEGEVCTGWKCPRNSGSQLLRLINVLRAV